MINARVNVPTPINEPVLLYAPGSSEKNELKLKLEEFAGQQIEIPLVIGGTEVRTGNLGECILPHDHRHVIASFHKGNTETVNQAIAAAAEARPSWAAMDWEARAAIFLRAAELLAGKYRQILNAATMLNQSKTAFQAEIDAACELIDFFRFNVSYLPRIFEQQPDSGPAIWNYVEYRPLEGFVFAVTPFNFTSIAGNLPTSPALMGNTVVWKPASTAVYSAYWLMELLKEAGLPDGVINMVPGSGSEIGQPAMNHPELGGVHFTGSTAVFQGMWKAVGASIASYKSYPRIVGETGGKDFVFAHASADPEALIANLIRGAYEYQGQKCSAASRAYLPKSFWDRHGDDLCAKVNDIKYGDITDFRNFMGAVIDPASYATITQAIEQSRHDSDADVVCGGQYDDAEGYFIAPTIIQAHDPHYTTMEVELFGPALTVFVYDDNKYEETLDLCDSTSPYALTGGIFGTDRKAINLAHQKLLHAAGNFYINDKPTGAVVGQQPFGGSRASGTNDKAGSYLNLIRWVSPRTTKENFVPALDYGYPHMQEK
ncbi:MAG TPA: L-glutamate gamma-semialdehyde dehydrogenase [Acidobacteria bacterium]|jgi:1-pyrroline-5-carboxylate dehydrogenase|nr:L-glutamate gamma-semialdehyde dehydrogenase [Acidobacteriota bacterium]